MSSIFTWLEGHVVVGHGDKEGNGIAPADVDADMQRKMREFREAGGKIYMTDNAHA